MASSDQGIKLARLPLATDEDLDRALEAAQRGFELWRATPGEQRAEILMLSILPI